MSDNSLAHLESKFLFRSCENKDVQKPKLCFLTDSNLIIRDDENSSPDYVLDFLSIEEVIDTSDGSTFSFAIRLADTNLSSESSQNSNNHFFSKLNDQKLTDHSSSESNICINDTNDSNITTNTENGSSSRVLRVFSFTASDLTTVRRWLTALRSGLSQNKINDNDGITSHSNLSLKDFQLLSVIGKGFSGEVILGRYIPTGKLAALKSIPKEGIQSSNCIKHAFAERNILMQASTPFITRLLSTFQTSDSLFFVLEFVRGGDLGKYISSGKAFSEYQIRVYLAEIAVALSHLHKLGIVFRDLKPGNILIDSKGHLKLTDFGLAKYLLVDDHASSLCGTHEYLAPEMIKGASYNFAVDWWAYGVVAYQLLEGVLPFESPNLNKLYERIVRSPLRFWKPVPNDAKNLIQGLLQKNPDKRLGCSENGEGEIFDHPYFQEIDWEKIKRKEYIMEFIPELSKEQMMQYFDGAKTIEDEDGSLFLSCSASNETHVPGFSYAGQGLESPTSEFSGPIFNA